MTDSQFSNKVRVRACAVIVQDSSILLAKINSPTRSEPIWMPPGGGVELGESLEGALLREIKEECNIGIKPRHLLWVHEFIEHPYHAIEFYFRCDVMEGEAKKGFDPELESHQQMLLDLSFVSFDKVENLDIEPPFIREFCKSGGEFFTDVRHVKNSNFEGDRADGSIF